MEHAVFYPGPDGAPAFRNFAGLDDAVRFVEHLRNVEGIEDVSVQMLTPVPLAFRAYYKVEMPAADVPAVPEQAAAELLTPVEPVLPEAVEEVAVEVPTPAEPAVSANGKRSLGFFAH